MTGRVDDARFRAMHAADTAPRVRTRARGLASGRQRAIFAFAILLFGVTTFYMSVAMLTRVTPALFPGKTFTDIPFVARALDPLPDVVRPSDPSPTSVFNRRINLLVIGIDRRPSSADVNKPASETDLGAYNTDTLMVATIDPVSKVISVLGIPRDMWIDVHRPGNVVYKDRVNASYATGFQADGGTFEAGANQLMKDVQADFGIVIDYWAIMDFKGVENLIDTVGGVTVSIPEELSVPSWYYTDDDQTNPHYESFPPGYATLNGYRAVAFGRYRNDSDLFRVKRQQVILRATLAKVFSNGLLDSDPRALYDAYTKLIYHNIPFARAGGYLPLIKDTNGEINFFSLGDPVEGRTTVWGFIVPDSGASVLLWDPDNVRYWIGQAFTKSKYARSTVELQSARGGGDSEAKLRELSRYLRFERFLPEVQLGPDATIQTTSSILVYSEDRKVMAEDIAGWLGLPKSAVTITKRTSDSQPDVVIVLGKDYKGPGS